MTISEQIPINNYLADGVLDTFVYTFTILEDADLVVTVDGILQVININYTLQNQTPLGGDVVFDPGSIPTTGAVVSLQRDTSQDQNTVYTEFDPFPADSHENALDKLTMLIQELSLEGSSGSNVGLPLDSTGTFWDAQNKLLRNLLTPTAAQDAATKAYVDAVSSSGFDPSASETITGIWTFTEIIQGVTSGNLILTDLDLYTQTIIAEVILAQWTFADGAGSQRKVGARNPRARFVIANDTPSQADEGAILWVDQTISSITLEQLEAQTTFTIVTEASGCDLLEGAGLTINFLDGLGLVEPTGDRVIARASSVQVMYKDVDQVHIFGNGIS